MPEDTKTLEYVRELAIQLANDPAQRGRVMKILAGDGTSTLARLLKQRNHNMPYYKSHFAQEIKFVLDRMIANKRTQEFRYVDYPRLSKHSLYLKVYQSFLWLIDFQDPDGAYITLRNQVDIKKCPQGVRIKHVNSDPSPLNVAEEVDETVEIIPEWRTKMDDFIEKAAHGEKLVLDKLKLKPEEVEELTEQSIKLMREYGILMKVSETRIVIVKPRPEDLAGLQT